MRENGAIHNQICVVWNTKWKISSTPVTFGASVSHVSTTTERRVVWSLLCPGMQDTFHQFAWLPIGCKYYVL